MKPYRPLRLLFLLCLFGAFSSCTDIIEPSISKSAVQPEAPSNQYQSTSYTVNFWWDEVDHALSYHLQVVTPSFAAPGSLVLDTLIKKNTFSVTLNPGSYQWRVMAENGSSQTSYIIPRNFTVISSSITQQAVQLIAPANNLLKNQGTINFQWSNLYGATKYQLEIDTNNFINESALVYNQTIPAQQLSFALPNDQVYQWRVKAKNDTAQSQWSTVNSVTYDHTPPAKITSVSPVDAVILPLPVALQWNSVTGAAKYKLYIFKSDGITIYSPTFPLLLTPTNYSFNAGNSGDKVYWMATALDAAGNGGPAGDLRSFALQ